MTEKEIVEILKVKYGKISAKYIAEECGISLSKIYHLARDNGIKTNKSNNKEIGELSELQEQILISGIFGAFEWYAIRRSEIQSKFIETQLIITYFGITGKYPPGNTGEY